MTDRTRKIAVAGILGAISVLLGATHWGFIPWFAGAALTIMHVPVIIGAILEGPVVGLVIGLIFGIFSLIQGVIAPTGAADTLFSNPLISVLPRLFIGPLAWLAYRGVKKLSEIGGLAVAGVVGSLTNSVLVLGMITLLGLAPLAAVVSIFLANSLAEAALGAIITVVVVAAWKRIAIGRRKGASV
jgi:uncharacterized membrane protein